MTGVRLTPLRVHVCGHLSSSKVIAATCTATNTSSAAGTGIGARSTTGASGPPWRWARSAVISFEPSSSHSTMDRCSQHAESDISSPPVVTTRTIRVPEYLILGYMTQLLLKLARMPDTAVRTLISGSIDEDFLNHWSMGYLTQYDCSCASCHVARVALRLHRPVAAGTAPATAISRADGPDPQGICPHINKENS